MKKFYWILVMIFVAILLLVPFGSAFAEDSAMPVSVYFYNSKKWEQVWGYAYYNSQPVDAAFPGMQLRHDEGDWYVFDIPALPEGAQSVNIIFSDGTDVEEDANRNEVYVTDKQYFNAFRPNGYDSKEAAAAPEENKPVEIVETGVTRVYYYNSKQWRTVKAYTYGVDAAQTKYSGNWPGTSVVKAEREHWVYLDVKQDCNQVQFNIIFNNTGNGGENQSVDTLIDHCDQNGAAYVNFNGQVFDDFASCEAATDLEEPPVVEVIDPQDYFLDFDSLPSAQNVVATTPQDLTIPIIILCVAAIADVALTVVLVVRRKK